MKKWKVFLIVLLVVVMAIACIVGFVTCTQRPDDEGSHTEQPNDPDDPDDPNDPDGPDDPNDPNDPDGPDDPNDPDGPDDPDDPHEHDFGEWVVTIPATCTEEGEEQRTCSCGETETRPIEATGHTEAIDAAVAPTCTETGLTEGKHCSVCNEVLVEQKVVPAFGHAWDEGTVTAPATCTQEGVMTYTCTRCGDTRTETIDPLGHAPAEAVRENEEASSCEEPGSYDSVVYCSRCRAELSREHIEGEIIGHAWDEGKVTAPATCTQEGVLTYTCTRCGDTKTEPIAMKEHTVVIDAAVAPTCTETGLTEGKHCSVCKKVLVEQEVLPATEHAYFSTVTKQPTCTETGVCTYTCTRCGDQYTAFIAALGHDYMSKVERGATCTQTGSILYTCTRCNNSYRITTYADHDYRLIETVAATCTQPGYQLFRCSACGDEYTIDIPAEAGHNYVGVVTVAPTTEREGVMTYTCTVCGDSYIVPLAKLNSGDGYVLLIQDRLPWTTDNNAVILNYLTDTQQIGGWELVTAAEAASVDFADYDVIYIANDQTTATYNRLKALDDELTQFVQAGGVLIYGACDHGWGAGDISYDLPGGVRIDNYYSNYNYIVDDTHDIITGVLTGGVKLTNDILYSTYSSHTTFHDLPEDHNVILQDAKGDPTLVEYALGNGYVIASGLTWEYTYERTFVNGTSFAKEIYDDLFVYAMMLADPCEHQYEKGETVAPICMEDGYTVYTCMVCGREYHGDLVPALGHDWDDGKVTTPATCTQEGVMTYTCERCGDTRTEPIAMKEHTEAIDAAVAPTCTEMGLTEGKHCSVCKKVLVEQEVVPALDHDWNEGTVTTPATCTQEGVMTYTCERCGDTKTETIAMKEHIIAIDAAVAPTCTETGLTEGSHCSVCGKVLVEQEVLQTIPHNYVNGVCTMCGKRDESYTTEGLVFTLSDDGTYYSVTDYTGSAKEVSIPSVHQGLPVTSIGDYAFFCCFGLTSIAIPDSVTSIGDGAFEDCSSLTSVTIGNGVTSIGEDAFQYCRSLTSVTIGDGVTSIGANAFYNCESLTSVTIGDGVTSIGGAAFAYCDSLTSITIPDSVTSIGEEAFYRCTRLTSVTIGDSVTSIGNSAFEGCSGLTSIAIPDSVTSIGEEAFWGCSNLTSITVSAGNSVYHSDGNCLIETESKTLISGCKNSIIPDDGSVTSIGDGAFYGCSGLTSVTIPDSVTSIGDWAFLSCSGLTSITIPDGVTSIGGYAFYGCTSLMSIAIPDSVTSIGRSAFYGCPIENATMPTLAIDSIPQYNLKTVVLTSGTSIGDRAFEACTSLTSITIPDSVTSIGGAAFQNCDSLTSISVAPGNPIYHSDENCLIETESKTLIAGCKNSVIPDDGSVTSIGSSAFYGCSGLTSIAIPDSVTSIGKHAFEGCENLTSVTIGSGVTSIGDSAFYWCTSLTSVIIPDSVKSIGEAAFRDCESLTSITIPDSVTSIEIYAFADCDSLTSITIPDSVTFIGHRAFDGCTSLTSVTFENPNGWSRGSYTLSAEDLSDPATAARYLRYTYYDYTWTRK